MSLRGCSMKRGFWCTELRKRCSDARLDGSCKQRRTRTVEFTRQLWPQPPKDARPWWCYINTLVFYDSDHEEIWRQRIPEADQILRERAGVDVHNVYLEWDDAWGWLLKFEASHEQAMSVWAHVFGELLETIGEERVEGLA